jgi:predicted Zn-dependent protease
MRSVVLFLVVLGHVSLSFAQARPIATLKPEVVERACHGPEIRTGGEQQELAHIEQRLRRVIKADGSHFFHVVLTRNATINAWEVPVDSTHHLVCVPVTMVHLMGDAEGELAFVVAHEIGHALDDLCRSTRGRLAVARSQGSLSALLGALLGGERGAYESSSLDQQKGCEERADAIGFLIFTRAGYNPFDAAGSFGRLEMLSGDTGTGLVSYLGALSSGHPMTPDRIKHMRALLVQQIKGRS